MKGGRRRSRPGRASLQRGLEGLPKARKCSARAPAKAPAGAVRVWRARPREHSNCPRTWSRWSGGGQPCPRPGTTRAGRAGALQGRLHTTRQGQGRAPVEFLRQSTSRRPGPRPGASRDWQSTRSGGPGGPGRRRTEVFSSGGRKARQQASASTGPAFLGLGIPGITHGRRRGVAVSVFRAGPSVCRPTVHPVRPPPTRPFAPTARATTLPPLCAAEAPL